MGGRADKHYQGKRVASQTHEPANPVNTEENAKCIKEKSRTEKRGFWYDYGYLLITVIVVVVLCRVIFQLAFVPTGSMESTIPTNSLLIAWRLPYLVSDPEMERGDVTIFWDEEMNKILVKRVIGLAGEEVSFTDGYTCINGQRIQEDYLPQQGNTTSEASFSVPEKSLFVMGDNRTGSWDSRFLSEPYIPLHAVQGRALVCIPLRQITLFETQKLGPIHIYLPIFGSIHTL